ncbi:hypothetical protein BU23DRAFT_459955, partial [Bimuria novae-zelandiae CBS 107.79]
IQYLSVLLSLVAVTTAIDIRLISNSNCNGGVLVSCCNMNPNKCCGVNNAAFRSVQYTAIPTNWNVQTRSYEGGNCNILRGLLGPQHSGTVCMNEADCVARLTGGSYNFSNKKRGAFNAEDCRPDLLGLADGTTYVVKDLDTDLFDELVCNLAAIEFLY